MNPFYRILKKLSVIIKPFKIKPSTPAYESPYHHVVSQTGGVTIHTVPINNRSSHHNYTSSFKMGCFTCLFFIVACFIISMCRLPLGTTDNNNNNNQPILLPFRNTSLPIDERVNDLLSRLTLSEIQDQSQALYGRPSPAIERLGIKRYVWITECLRGQVGTNTTAFPQSIGLAASFNRQVIREMTMAIGDEVRAQWNNKVKQNQYTTQFGLNCFSPVINIMRHPLWGRNQETYGEDPFLSGELAKEFIRGLRGTHERYVKVGACCKHFDVHAGPENIPVTRFSFDSKVSMRDWRMTFMPQFRACADVGVSSYMCSYNRINGIPACANKFLLTNVTRNEWKFKGFIISDAGAIMNIKTYHKYTKTDLETVVASITSGTNIELTGMSPKPIYTNIMEAVHKGLMTEQQIRDNFRPLIKFRFQLGEFDPPSMVPYNKIGMDMVQNLRHRRLAVKAAQQSFVLLKNRNDFLPIKDKLGKIAVVGPMANNGEQMFGNYRSNLVKEFTSTPYEAFKSVAELVNFASGCKDSQATRCMQYDSQSIINAVNNVDIIFVCLGTGQVLESESNDRSSLDLPGQQLQLLKDVINYGNGRPVVLLLFNGGPLDLSFADGENNVMAILECFFPAQSTGEALMNTLLMKDGSYSVPGGRLPSTWYKSLSQIPPITDYTMNERTYRYFTQLPLYPFGYGLSYTRFQYESMDWPLKVNAGDDIRGSVMLKNIGNYDADEVVQVYMTWNTTYESPIIQLVGFERVSLEHGTTKKVEFIIKPRTIALWIDDQIGFRIVEGNMRIFVGGQQPGQIKNVGSNVLQAEIHIIGSAFVSK